MGKPRSNVQHIICSPRYTHCHTLMPESHPTHSHQRAKANTPTQSVSWGGGLGGTRDNTSHCNAALLPDWSKRVAHEHWAQAATGTRPKHATLHANMRQVTQNACSDRPNKPPCRETSPPTTHAVQSMPSAESRNPSCPEVSGLSMLSVTLATLTRDRSGLGHHVHPGPPITFQRALALLQFV